MICKILKKRFLNDLASPNASISTRSVSYKQLTIKQSTIQQYGKDSFLPRPKD